MSASHMIKGAVQIESVARVEREVQPLLTQSPLTIDFSQVSEVDSTAVSLMLQWRRHAKANGRQLHFSNLPASLLSLAQLYGVEEMLTPQP